MIKLKRIYEFPDKGDGYRILIDRLWPRGVTKDRAKVDLWLKDAGPSNDLRKWFAHDMQKCDSFKKKYFRELKNKEDLLSQILARVKKGNVTILYGARNQECNNATALKEYLGLK